MAYIKKTATGYRAQTTINGQRKSKSFSSKREAQDWASKEEADVRENLAKSPASKFTLKQALEKYRDEIAQRNAGERWERIRINAFLEHPDWLPLHKNIGDVSTEDFSKFRDERAKTVKPGTVLREFGILSSVMETARREWKWIKENPIRDVKKPSEPAGRTRLITRPEIKLMLRGFGYQPQSRTSSLTQSIAVCFLLALRAGMRAGDLTGLKWANVHPRFVRVEIDKVGRRKGIGRDVPLSLKAVRVLEKMRGFDIESVFGLTTQTLDARFRTVRGRAGLDIRHSDGTLDKEKTFTFHDSRHTAATWIGLSAKLSVMQMCSMFGWTDPKMAMRYFNPGAGDIATLLD